MRIIAGKYRRRKLLANAGLTTRPITDRAKEMLFENLGGELHGERVADIFSGTGSMGLEALSRGAARVVFLELDRHGHELLRENVRVLGVEDESICWRTDVLRCSFLPKGVEGFTPYDLIFFDPPFPMLRAMRPGDAMWRSLERLARPSVSAPDCRLILRSPPDETIAIPEPWEPRWSLDLSGMEIYVYGKPSL